jgi:hypothetical protein
MGRGIGSIGPTVLLALLGLPVVALAGLWWRLFPSERREVRHPLLDEIPAADGIAEG